MADNTYNPIRSVDGVAVRCPSSFQYGLQDVSKANAGRTEDGKMHKEKIGQCVKIELRWDNIDSATVSAILQAFDPEYISVIYKDAKRNAFRTATFYVGDRTTPMYNARLGLWSNLSFNIIERDCK